MSQGTFFPLLGKMAFLISGIKSLMPLPWYRASLSSVHALRHQNTGKAAYKTCSGSLCGRGRGEGLCYPAFMQSFAPLVSITREICLCPLSSPSPLSAGKTRGSTWDCFLWCWALPVPKAHSSSACKHSDLPQSCGGKAVNSAQSTGGLSLSQEKGPAAGQCLPWSLPGAGLPVST